MLQLKLVSLRTIPAPPERLPENYNANARCEFHSRGVGHDIENCLAFKHKVQDLLDTKAIQLTPDNGPNVIQNPMPPHTGPLVNAVEEGLSLIKDVKLLKTPLLSIKEYLITEKVFPGCFHDCWKFQEVSDGCDKLKCGIQKLIDEGSLQCEKIEKDTKVVEKEISVISIPYSLANIPAPARPAPLTIIVPSPIPFSSEKAIPWHYGSDVYYHGVKQVDLPKGESSIDESLNVENFAGVGKITRSGRVYTPQEVQRNADDLARAKGKAVQVEGQSSGSVDAPRSDFVDREVEELLRIIKKSDYKVVDHLSQTPSKISILSHVLVDTGSSLNVLPKIALMKIDYAGVELRPTDLIVKAFDGSRRSVFGEVDLPIKIGPQVFNATFFVMDIQPAYCCLLGRP